MLITLPEFKSVPKCTLADVPENIDHWIKNKNTLSLENYLRPDKKGYKGYRFVREDDLIEVITEIQVISKLSLTVQFTRKYRAYDHFCPLYFRIESTDIVYFATDIISEVELYKTDTQLRRYIKQAKLELSTLSL